VYGALEIKAVIRINTDDHVTTVVTVIISLRQSSLKT